MNDIAPHAVIERPEDLPVPRPVFQPLASPSTKEICTALAIAQGQFRAPKRTKEATVQGTTSRGQPYSYKFSYAPLEEIVEAVKEGLAANGLARHQYLATRGDQPIIRTIIWHASGEWIASDYPIHPSKEGAQGFASGVTYARRYGLSLALGLAPEDDDDGNMADGTVAEVRGKPAARRSAPAVPTPNFIPPLETPKAPEVFDPESGEIVAAKPHRLLVPETPKGGRDWPVWGAKLIGAFGNAATIEELREWEAMCTDEIAAAKDAAPRVFKSTSGAYQKALQRLLPDGEAPADFMPASE